MISNWQAQDLASAMVLPGDVDSVKTKAKFREGVLEVMLVPGFRGEHK